MLLQWCVLGKSAVSVWNKTLLFWGLFQFPKFQIVLLYIGPADYSRRLLQLFTVRTSDLILSVIPGEDLHGECGSCERTMQGDRQSGDSYWWTWKNEPETCQTEANWQP